MNRPSLFRLLTVASACLLPAGLLCAESAVVPAARVAIVGDSITEQKLYSKFLECYLLACSGVPDVKVMLAILLAEEIVPLVMLQAKDK